VEKIELAMDRIQQAALESVNWNINFFRRRQNLDQLSDYWLLKIHLLPEVSYSK
jgi:hypothetical protein